ncbi:hypothetical protein COY32_03615 [candidate division WWE3 bacterium CG_4_10_14_0_2_um_filter_41_14]|uniref:Glycosyltransferase RgtA/B/C/D-like domain-containing protein n=1 Tax=candidate division WWE3 bacterium CG_4_10_14_0_2_um_filter_41_14 TaxID=1975072 RepID=A0A2M7TIL3_UNCKA|nr:MAG: hypothetical protein COY32_03615 [candidate division WWE3 bacterium CG_4_10_14_0_2_um_filter_41_14]
MELLTKIQSNAQNIFWVAYGFLLFGYGPSQGYWNGMLLPFLVVSAALLLVYVGVSKDSKKNLLPVSIREPVILVMFSIGIGLLSAGHLTYAPKTITPMVEWFYVMVIPLVGLYLLDGEVFKPKFALILLCVLYLRVIYITSGIPPIDVFDFVNSGVHGLLAGKNPYAMFYTISYNGTPADYYGYFPSTLLLTIPGAYLFSDLRVTYLVVDFVTMGIIYWVVAKRLNLKKYAEVLVLLFALNPVTFYMTEFAWIEPLMVFSVAMVLFFYITNKSNLWALFVGIFLTIKQYNILFLLPFIRLKKWTVKTLLVTGLFVEVLLSYFILLSPKDFLHDTVQFHLSQPPRWDAQTITTFLHVNFKLDSIPLPIIGGILLMVCGYAFFVQNGRLSQAILGGATILFIAFLINQQAFVNYYYFINSALILFIVAYLYEQKDNRQISKDKTPELLSIQ